MIKPHSLVLAVLSVVALAAGFAPSAHAGYGSIGTFSGPGSGDGELSQPGRAAVERSTGNVFVVDSGNDRVQVFAPDGSSVGYLTQFGAGELDAPYGIAIYESAGHTAVYVSDAGNDRILRYESDEAATPSFTLDGGFASPAQGGAAGEVGSFAAPLATDPGSGDLLVADRVNARLSRYAADGTYESTINGFAVSEGPFSGLLDVAVDSTGDVITVESETDVVADTSGTGARVSRYNAAGARERTIGPVDGAGAVAVDPDNDNVVVAGRFHAWNSGQTPHLWVFGADGTAVADFDVNAWYAVTMGLAAADGSGRLYAVTTDPFNDIWGPTGGFVFEDVAPPTVSLGEATDVTSGSARFEGVVNAQGTETTYRLHFFIPRLNQNGWDNGTTGVATGTSDVPVTLDFDAHTSGAPLQPATEYEVWLTASNPGGSIESNRVTFTTAPAAPRLEPAPPGSVTDTTAVVGALVDPRNSATTLRVEYGTDASYGATVPAAPGEPVGDGGSYVPASVRIAGLSPSTEYHYRVVAESAGGVTVGDDRTFVTGSAAPTGLPDGRAYEMVTPADKNGFDVRRFIGSLRSSDSGDAATYLGIGTFAGDAEGSAVLPRFLSRRAAAGWSTRAIDPPGVPTSLGHPFTGLVHELQGPSWFSSDLSKSVVMSWRTPLAPGDENRPVIRLYRRDLATDAYDLLSEPLDGWDAAFFDRPWPVAVTDDQGHILFESSRNLTPDSTGGAVKLYEWDHGTIRRADVLPDGSPAVEGGAPGASPGSLFQNPRTRTDNVLSADGSRVFFTALPRFSDGRLFMRENGGTPEARTVWVSESEHSSPSPAPQPALFRDATPDGSKILFTTAEQLVDEDANAGEDLYRYDVNAPDGERLTLVSADAEPADGGISQVQGVLGLGDDGSRIYFVASGQLVAGGQTEPGYKLYVWDDGETRQIASLSSNASPIEGSDTDNWTQEWVSVRPSRVSRDGRHLLFRSNAPLVAYGGDPSQDSFQGRFQFYLYDAEDESDQALTCVSCDPSGEPATASAPTTGTEALFNFANHMPYLPRTLVEHGAGVRVYFHSANDLVPQDTNGKVDAYEYDSATRRVALISAGKSRTDSFFMDASADGRDVFFVTNASLVGWDRDGNRDVYDARVGGGFPEPPPATPPCSGDACQGGSDGHADRPRPGSADLHGGGDVASGRRASFTLAAITAAQRARLARDGHVTLAVRVNRAGKLTVVLRAKIGKRRTTVASASRRVRRAGTVRVRLELSKAARAQLARGRKLDGSLVARFGGTAESRRIGLRRPAARRATAPATRPAR